MKSKQELIIFFEKADPKLISIIDEINYDDWFDLEHDSSKYFYDLCRTIVGQQLAGKAASTIFARFEKTLVVVTPENILNIEQTKLRDAGLSWAKVRSVVDLSQRVVSGDLVLADLQALDDENLIMELSRVRGIGRWTSEMFLMFRLGREDIFSLGDLGLKNGLKKYLSKEELTKEEMVDYTAKWSPYRTYGAIAMWHLLDNR